MEDFKGGKRMIQILQRRFALSRQGAVDLIKGCIACVFQDISFMLPVGLLYSFVIDLMNRGVNGSRIAFYAVGALACLVLIFIVTYFQYNATYLATYVESGVRRVSLAEQLRKIPLSFFGKKDLADLTNSIMGDCATLETAFSHYVPALAGSLISTTLIAVCLFAYDWRMALAAVWVLPIAFVITFFSARIQTYFNRKSVEANVALESGVQECIESLQDLKANNAEKSYLKGLNKKIDYVEKRHIITELGTALFVVSSTLILKFGIATVALVGSVLLIRGEIDVPLFFLFLLVASRLYAPLEGALQNLAAVISTKPNINRMNEILDKPIQTGSNRLTNQGYDIVFDHVGFAYNTGETVLKDVSFTAKQGEVTALVGPSGGGKTTVSRLAARFWDIGKGKITVGGMDISEIEPETLLSLYSIVFQDVTLFNNTVIENIRIGRKDATDEEVIAAAKLANCDEFVVKLPDGYSSMIGENGCELSGGERQRISIARAFLKNAPIILLDEATASLDVENETLIQTALSTLIKDKTTLVIAHRMRTVSGADKVVVLSGGLVAEQGTPETLMNTGTIYPHMVKLQTLSRDWGI
jgi:ATP-binding cassette subfamily B protein IrtB